MDWILYPESVDIGVCKGSCKTKGAPIVSNKTETKRLAYKFNLTSEQETTSCAPTVFQPLRIIYRNEDGILFSSSVSDFSISECGCL